MTITTPMLYQVCSDRNGTVVRTRQTPHNDESSSTAPYVNAVTRDIRQYLREQNLRTVPVGYSAARSLSLPPPLPHELLLMIVGRYRQQLSADGSVHELWS